MLGWGWVLPRRVRAVLGLASSEGSLQAPGQLSSPGPGAPSGPALGLLCMSQFPAGTAGRGILQGGAAGAELFLFWLL